MSETNHVTLRRQEGESRFRIALENTGRAADVKVTHSNRAARRTTLLK